jgi:hypothetical protein
MATADSSARHPQAEPRAAGLAAFGLLSQLHGFSTHFAQNAE